MRQYEQKKMLEALKRYERKMEMKELEEFKMLVKRHKDDEDFDNISFSRLKELYTKYHSNRPKPNLDDLFKKPDNEN